MRKLKFATIISFTLLKEISESFSRSSVRSLVKRSRAMNNRQKEKVLEDQKEERSVEKVL